MPSTLESLTETTAAAASSEVAVSISKKRRRRRRIRTANTTDTNSSASDRDSDSDYSDSPDYSDADTSDDDKEEKKKKKKSRKGVERASSSSPIETEYSRARKGQQQWTELTAVCHVFCDEVHKYINPIDSEEAEDGASSAAAVGGTSASSSRKRKQPPHLSMGEKRQLTLLMEKVKERVDKNDSRVLENRLLVHETKQAKCRVRDRRNEIMITRLLARKAEGEVAALERQVRQMKRDGEKLRQASKFLSAIECLAKKTTTVTAAAVATNTSRDEQKNDPREESQLQ